MVKETLILILTSGFFPPFSTKKFDSVLVLSSFFKQNLKL